MITLRRLAMPHGGDVDAATQIPYRTHVAPTVVRTAAGDYLSCWRLRGMPFECQAIPELNAAHERLNAWMRSIAAPEVAVWTHVIRRRDYVAAMGDGPQGFPMRLLGKYRDRMQLETLWANDLYLTIVLRPAGVLVDQGGSGHAASLDAMAKLRRQVEASLATYTPEILGTYDRAGQPHSAVLEFLSLLVNAESHPVPLPGAPISEVLGTARLLLGWETIEYRQPVTTRYGAFLGIKEYPGRTAVGILDALLTAPFPFVLTQSFACMAKAAAMGLLSRQAHRLRNAGDAAISQLQSLTTALDRLASNEFAMGQHHLSLQVLTEPVPAAGHKPTRELVRLEDALAGARSRLSDAGILVAREDVALEPAFWAQLPGNFAVRPRVAPITSRNFVALAPMHNYPTGRAVGNHWGDCLAVLKTSAASAFHFSLHATDPRDPDGGSRRDTGHTFICGPTGSGKTVFLAFCMCLLMRQGVTQVVFDKDRGLEVLVRAVGGTYLTLQHGMPTGCNPLQMPDSPGSRSFLRRWLLELVHRPGRAPTVREEAELDQALEGVMGLDAGSRRLSRILDFLDPTSPEGIHARLAPWCEATAGVHAWVFDSPRDSVADQVLGSTIVGFDMTEVLDDDLVRGPLTHYLFHVVEGLLDGRRLVAWLDEFSRLVGDPGFADLASDGTKTWRKRNGVIAFVTQSPSDVLESPVARALVEQTPTKVLFPNADARMSDYIDGLGLNEREYSLVKTDLTPGSRRFLVKQGREGVVAELDLKGLDAEMKVLSGRSTTLRELQSIVEELGNDPEQWLPRLLGDRAH
jgi:type IV secretion system protein VirB4